jgi:DNA-binding transcriptional ArsR family regulator
MGVRRMCGRISFSTALICSRSIAVFNIEFGPQPANLHVVDLSRLIAVLLYLGSWLIVYMSLEPALRALSSDRRLQVLAWLKQPTKHFPPQVDGDLVRDGVCGVLIARKLRVSQPTASEHLKILLQAGLVRAKRIKQWTFYKRDEARIRKIKKMIQARV